MVTNVWVVIICVFVDFVWYCGVAFVLGGLRCVWDLFVMLLVGCVMVVLVNWLWCVAS